MDIVSGANGEVMDVDDVAVIGLLFHKLNHSEKVTMQKFSRTNSSKNSE